jgi:polar amino acid transport system substrate-binding protein
MGRIGHRAAAGCVDRAGDRDQHAVRVKALGAVMGLKVKVVNATFDSIIPGLAAGKYDLGASSFTDTKMREKQVDFVDYFTAGESFYTNGA